MGDDAGSREPAAISSGGQLFLNNLPSQATPCRKQSRWPPCPSQHHLIFHDQVGTVKKVDRLAAQSAKNRLRSHPSRHKHKKPASP
ncbi:hypothetical protein VTN00DRAFT_2279 [Thermoascus crustaceus]|uniref:uncharacterized protein n=1 Tax=Thermoascus crustaceus TaxID=5088 RepID=UPI003741FE65